MIIGTICWQLDYHLCEYIQNLNYNPQAHAIWHLLSAVNIYMGPIIYESYVYNLKINYNNLNLPIIKIYK